MSRCYRRPTLRAWRDSPLTTFSNRQDSCIFALAAARKTICQAYARAGLPYTRSHLLRHTMANRLLAGGSSLKEVADTRSHLLRHRSLNTTLIYAKLDSRNLVAVALPWPGSAE